MVNLLVHKQTMNTNNEYKIRLTKNWIVVIIWCGSYTKSYEDHDNQIRRLQDIKTDASSGKCWSTHLSSGGECKG